MVYEYGMEILRAKSKRRGRNFKTGKRGDNLLLKGTNEQIARISSYLLAYESVDKETLAKILNENY
ncbi:hypothetical protein VB002_01105 [Campylobacter concisus]